MEKQHVGLVNKGLHLQRKHASPGGEVGATGVAANEPQQRKRKREEENDCQPQPQV